MTLRRSSLGEVVIQVLLGLILILNAFEFFSAVGESACSAPAPTKGCHPWGTEGPTAGRWDCLSKRNYVVSSLAPSLILAAAIIAPFLSRRVGISFGPIAVILIVGFGGLEVAGPFLR